MVLILAAVAVAMAVVTAALFAFLVLCELRQAAYRRRLAAGPMHVHNGRPCYGEACAPIREEAAA